MTNASEGTCCPAHQEERSKLDAWSHQYSCGHELVFPPLPDVSAYALPPAPALRCTHCADGALVRTPFATLLLGLRCDDTRTLQGRDVGALCASCGAPAPLHDARVRALAPKAWAHGMEWVSNDAFLMRWDGSTLDVFQRVARVQGARRVFRAAGAFR